MKLKILNQNNAFLKVKNEQPCQNRQNQTKEHIDLKLVRQKFAARRAAKIFGGKKGIYSIGGRKIKFPVIVVWRFDWYDGVVGGGCRKKSP